MVTLTRAPVTRSWSKMRRCAATMWASLSTPRTSVSSPEAESVADDQQLGVGALLFQLLQEVDELRGVIAMLQLTVATHVQVADKIILLCQGALSVPDWAKGSDRSSCTRARYRYGRLYVSIAYEPRAARPFWIAVFASIIVAIVLLHEVLLPFVAGMVLAYLLDPLTTRLERLGMNRLIATLTIVGLFVVGVTALIILTAPVVVGELAYFIDNFPLYIKRVQGLATDPNRPWLSKLVGEGLASAEQSVGELTTLATDWLRDFLHSVWTGGRALISALSLLVVTPIIAC